MKTRLRTSFAVAASIAVLGIAAVSAANAHPTPAMDDVAARACHEGLPTCELVYGSPTPAPAPVEGGTAMCVQSEPDCNDMAFGGGSDGGGEPVETPPSDGRGSGGGATGDPTCGEVVQGDAPDATVSYTPCDTTETPVPVDPSITVPTPGMANVRSRTFDTAMIGDDDRTVTIDYYSGIEPCSALDHIDVVETADTVTITLYEGNDPSGDNVVCPDIAIAKRTVVTLDAPLGDRTIVDGAA